MGRYQNVRTLRPCSQNLYPILYFVGDAAIAMQNPYWINYRNLRENKKDRYMLNAGLSYQIFDWLNIAGRVRLDNTSTNYTENFMQQPILS